MHSLHRANYITSQIKGQPPSTIELAAKDLLPRAQAQPSIGDGLANIARHARASQAWVRLAQVGEALEITTRHDGRGFDREGLQLILETSDEIEVVGEAEDGGEALRLTEELQPDVVLMDLQMPRMAVRPSIERLQREQPEVAIVILTTYNEDEMMFKGLQLGARGYLLKDTDRQTLLDTIRTAAQGEALLKPEILQRVLTYREETGAAAPAGQKDRSPLSPTERELEVLRAAAHGERNKEIAFRLGISERTVKAHLTSVYNKLGVDSRAAAIAMAAQKGWLSPP